MKCGGIAKSLGINKICEDAHTRTMIGCMGENRVSITAGLHFALSQKNVHYADLDSHFSLVNDNMKGGFTFEDGYLVPLDEPGFGVEVEF
jgi:L-alanine-DL-glutamate epimerase-like enolase superfamily enzyme